MSTTRVRLGFALYAIVVLGAFCAGIWTMGLLAQVRGDMADRRWGRGLKDSKAERVVTSPNGKFDAVWFTTFVSVGSDEDRVCVVRHGKKPTDDDIQFFGDNYGIRDVKWSGNDRVVISYDRERVWRFVSTCYLWRPDSHASDEVEIELRRVKPAKPRAAGLP